MTTKNDFGLEGVANNLQYGKSGGRLIYNPETNTFNITLANQTTFANIKADAITSENGNIVINSVTGKLTISDSNLSLEQTGVFKFEGTAALSIPSGTNEERPGTASLGMVRINNTVEPAFLEYYNGTTWVNTSEGGSGGGGSADAVDNAFAIAYFFG